MFLGSVNPMNLYAQASVYLARSGKGNARRVKARSVHAPARRLARTTISLGPDEGIAFGLRAVRCSPLLTTTARRFQAPACLLAYSAACVCGLRRWNDQSFEDTESVMKTLRNICSEMLDTLSEIQTWNRCLNFSH